MFARSVAPQPDADLYDRIGAFLRAQGLAPEPANYVFAYELLACDDAAARAVVDRMQADGVRLSRAEIEAMGGNVVAGPGLGRAAVAAASRQEEAADRAVAQTRAQVEAVAIMMRTMHDETRGFGRDLAESAAAFGEQGARASSGDIVRLTHAMIARAADTEARLERAAAETEQLRVELAAAQESARRDPLTGLPNRRAFAEAFAEAPRRGRCLAVCDIDRFKRINDQFGHAVGDRVLSAVARILADRCDGHLVTRQGGEEFAVLLDGDDLDRATALLDGAREAVAERRFRTRDTDAPIGRVTFSAGVVVVGEGEEAEAALARADALLYRAKADGRDRVIAG